MTRPAEHRVGRTRPVATPVPDRWSSSTESGLQAGSPQHTARDGQTVGASPEPSGGDGAAGRLRVSTTRYRALPLRRWSSASFTWSNAKVSTIGAVSWRAAKSSMAIAVDGLPEGELDTERFAIMSAVPS